MATATEQVLIYLKTIGAAATRRDLNSVADALDRLNSRTSGNTKENEDNERAINDTNAARGRSIRNLKKEADGTRNLTKYQRMHARQTKMVGIQSDTTTRKSIDNLKRLQREEMMALRARQRRMDMTYRAYLGYLRDEGRAAERAAREETMRERRKMTEWKKINTKRQGLLKKLNPLAHLGGFRRPGRVALYGTIALTVADAITFLGTGLNALGAGAIAAVNGLAPLTGMLITYPAMIGAMVQGVTVLGWAFSDMVKAVGGDKDALAKLPKNARETADALSDLAPKFDKVQRSTQNAFWKDVGPLFRDLGKIYLPTIKREMVATAAAINSSGMTFAEWLTGKKGQSTISSVMKTNTSLIGNMSGAMFGLVGTIANLIDAAGPMLRRMGGDLNGFFNTLFVKTGRKKNSLGDFFTRSYGLFKKTKSVLGDFGTGLMNLFKQSAPLSYDMGLGIEKAAKGFKKWTKSKGGIQKMRDYFLDMAPNLQAIVKLGGEFAKTIFRLSKSPKFASMMDQVRTKLLPAIERIATAAEGKFIPALLSFFDSIAKLVDSGVIDTLSEIGSLAADLIGKFSTWFSERSPLTKKMLVWSAVIVGLFGGILSAILGVVGALGTLIPLLGKIKPGGALSRMGGYLFGGGGGGATRTGKGGKGGGKGGGGGAVVTGGGGKSGKKGKGGGGSVVAGGGGGTKKGKKAGATKKPRSGKGKMPGAAGAAGAVGASLAFLAAGPIADQLGGVDAALSDLDFKAGTALNTLGTKGATVGKSLNSMFADVDQGNMKTFDGALTQVANPTKWMKFEQGVAAVGGAVLGATPPLDVAKAKFEAIDTSLTNMPADQAATAFGKIRAQATQMGVPMEKLTALFPQYRDSVANTATASDKAAGGMKNATVAANLMQGGIKAGKRELMDIDTMKKPTVSIKDDATPKVKEVGSGVKSLNDLAAKPKLTASDQATPKIKTASGALGGLNGKTAKTAIKTSNEAPGAVSAATGALNGLNGKTAVTYIKTVKTSSTNPSGNVNVSSPSSVGRRWTGGMTNAGQTYLTGEHGPELAMTRNGGMSLLGANGPQYFTPGSRTAIVPHGATKDPFGGNYGYAPDWAKRMLQGGKANTEGMQNNSSGQVFAPSVKIKVINPGANVDVKRAVKDALNEMKREQEARQ